MRGFKTASNPQGINPHFTFSKLTGWCPLTNYGEEQQAYYNNTRLALAAAFRTKHITHFSN